MFRYSNPAPTGLLRIQLNYIGIFVSRKTCSLIKKFSRILKRIIGSFEVP